ncbi:MAG: prolipoprotein diacylglyceryl transferase, partial [Gammaproteobacteria bacterium]|nr:prolipoprotein diacylglyceryl transferase [Gammaproteobacteria bacterium]
YPFLGDLLNSFFATSWVVPIPMFGLLVATAIVAATYVARQEVIRYESAKRLPPKTSNLVSDLAIIGAISGILGARIFHLLEYPHQFLIDPLGMIFSRGGFSIYGGLLLGVLAGIVFLKKKAVPIAPMLDVTAPSLMLGYAIGRVGCQLSGDGDWGAASNLAAKPGWLPQWAWSQTYENNVAGVVIADPGVYPTPLYETGMALIAFGVLWCLRKHRNRAGFLFSIYLLLSGFERLLIEKIRINPDYEIFDLSFTQAEGISLVLIVFGVAGVLGTITARKLFPKAVFFVAVLASLAACMHL